MAVRFATNVPLTVKFPYGDFKEITGTYGLQYLYTVELAGQRDKLFATPLLHQELQAAGVGPGAVLTVAKVEAEGNRKSWVVRPEEPEEETGNGGPGPTVSAPAPASANGHHPQTGHPDFADMQTLMGHCLKASWAAWQGVEEGDFAFTSEDVRGVGITLFLECARKGLVLSVEAEEEERLPF